MDLTIQHVENLRLGTDAGDANDIQSLFAQSPDYTTASVPHDSFTDSDWDWSWGDAPNPSEGGDAREWLRDVALVYPTDDEAADSKDNYHLPYRSSPDAPVNRTALEAIVAAINGARGGVDIPESVARDAYAEAVDALVAAGDYDSADDAPDFSAADSGLPESLDPISPFVADLWRALLARTGAGAAADWTPALHPRGDDGKFVERPYSVPDSLSSAGTEEIVNELAQSDPDFQDHMDDLNIDGVDDVQAVVDDSQGGDGFSDGDLSEKPTEELRDLVDYLDEHHSQAREARRGQGGRSTDTELDQLMRDTLDRLRRVEDELRSRGAASAGGTASVAASAPFRASVSPGGADTGDDLRGVVWAAGDHEMYVDGDPTPVHVPDESIPRTYEAVQSRLSDGDPPKLGLDHGDNLHKDTVPVATELDKFTIGSATGFDLSDDGTKLVMTDYDLTDQSAVDAAEDGRFADKDYSIVGSLRIHADDDGEPKTVESGGKERLVVTAETVRKVDVVETGAVSGAGPGTMPPLRTAASLAAKAPAERATAYSSSLRAAAKHADNHNMKSLSELEDLEDPEKVLSGAAEVVDQKDDRIDRLEAVASAAGLDVDGDDAEDQAEAIAERADAAETLAALHGVDLAAEDTTPQDLVDEYTQDLREEIAAKEARLPKYDTSDDDVDDRAAELAGSSPDELRALNGERANEILQSEEARAEYGKAHAEADGAEGDVGGSSSGAGDDQVEEVAASAMTVDERLEFRESDHDSAAEFMAEKYDEDPADYVGDDNPASAFVAATAGGEQ